MCQGQQTVGYGRHPTATPPRNYQWEHGHPLITPRWELPLIKTAELFELRNAVINPILEGFGYEHFESMVEIKIKYGEPNGKRPPPSKGNVVPFTPHAHWNGPAHFDGIVTGVIDHPYNVRRGLKRAQGMAFAYKGHREPTLFAMCFKLAGPTSLGCYNLSDQTVFNFMAMHFTYEDMDKDSPEVRANFIREKIAKAKQQVARKGRP